MIDNSNIVFNLMEMTEDDGQEKKEKNTADKIESRAESYLQYMKDFDQKNSNISSFASAKWLVAVFSQALEVSVHEMKHLIDIFECNTFESIIKDVGTEDVEVEKNAVTFMTSNLEAYYKNRIMKLESFNHKT